VLTARDQGALEALAEELPGDGHRGLASDLAEPGAAERLVAETGEVDVLVANAGLPGAGRLTDFSSDEVARALRVNLEAPMLMARALTPAMVERGSGHMVFVASLNAKAATAQTSIYCATKFGLRGFALSLRADLASNGVGVSIVSPGFIGDAGMFADSGAKPPPPLGTRPAGQVGAAVVRAVERNRAEIVVAPIIDRALSHFALAAPVITARVQGSPISQRAAAGIAEGHPEDKR
jgi:short-subunit dehydrogenase